MLCPDTETNFHLDCQRKVFHLFGIPAFEPLKPVVTAIGVNETQAGDIFGNDFPLEFKFFGAVVQERQFPVFGDQPAILAEQPEEADTRLLRVSASSGVAAPRGGGYPF